MDSIVGVSWGETLGDTIAEIESKKKTNAMFVPIAGGPSHINSKYHVNTLVYEMARKFSGQNIFVNATVIQETPQLKKGIMDSKYFKELKDYWGKIGYRHRRNRRPFEDKGKPMAGLADEGGL